MVREDKRLHICLGQQCNNNCLFCMEADRAGRARRFAALDSGTVKGLLAAAPDRGEILFTAGEPTLREDLPELIGEARELGFVQVGMISNGRRLSYLPYLKGLVGAGLNYVLVSIHGPTGKLHDGLTRTPGSFAQTVGGLRNIQALRRGGSALRFVATTVVNLRNLPVLAEHIRFLEGFEPDEIVLNAIQPLGGGERHFTRLVPRHTDLVAGVKEALAKLGRTPERLRLLDVPPCLVRDLPPSVVGFVEAHRHYEPAADTLTGTGGRVDGAPRGAGGEVLELVTKEELDDVLRVKGPECPQCQYHASCDGLWRVYAEHYGFTELRPMAAADEGANE